MFKYKAVMDKIVCKEIKLEVENNNSIIIPESVQEKINQSIYQVISVGEDVKEVKVGDLITSLQMNAMEVKIGNDIVVVIPESGVLFVMEHDESSGKVINIKKK